MLNVLYEDKDIIVCIKPVGTSSQAERGNDPDMVSLLRNHGLPYVGVVHRLDKPVSGIMVYACNKESAASLSQAVKNGMFNKQYYAVICTHDIPKSASYTDYLLHDVHNNRTSILTGTKREKEGLKSSLDVNILSTISTEDLGTIPYEYLSLADIKLYTGRSHQIRAMCAYHGMPLLGDMRYNPVPFRRTSISLYAHELSFVHPRTKRPMTFTSIPDTKNFGFSLFTYE